MLRASVAMAMVALLAAAPAAAKRKTPDAELAELLKGRTAEPAVRCITPTTNDSQRIISGKAIVYGNGHRIWVNVPIGRLDTMRWDDVLVTERFGHYHRLSRDHPTPGEQKGCEVKRTVDSRKFRHPRGCSESQ